MISIQLLPFEIILKILKNVTISLRDVESFSSTCNDFQYISHDKNLWKKKYAQRWPTALVFCKDIMGIEFDDVKIKDLKKGMKCAEDLWKYVSFMPEIYQSCKHNKDIAERIQDFLYVQKNKHPLNIFIIFDELNRNIYHQDPRQSNLTERYYGIKILPYLKKDNCFFKWKRVVDESNQLQCLEDLFVIILQYYHPDKSITNLHVDKFIDNIVQKVLKFLKDKYSQHPILTISSTQFWVWRNNRINKNFWCEEDAMSIKSALDKIIVNFDSYESWMEPNQIIKNLINKSVIGQRALCYKHKLWLTIYLCVANRLGLYVITTPHYVGDNVLHTHLAWQSRNCTESIECFTFEWTDKPNNVKISNIRKCQRVLPDVSDTFAALLMSPISMKTIPNICSLWLFGGPSSYVTDNSISSLIDLYDAAICTPDEMVCKKRSPNLKYAIGLIVKHKHNITYNTRQDITGVIIGWHNECHIKGSQYERTHCTSNDIKEECIQKYNIKDWKSQPYYILLVENNLCYVPQYAITSTCEEWINNLEIGKYFCKFEGTHYVPNELLRKYYPDDYVVVREVVSKRKSRSKEGEKILLK